MSQSTYKNLRLILLFATVLFIFAGICLYFIRFFLNPAQFSGPFPEEELESTVFLLNFFSAVLFCLGILCGINTFIILMLEVKNVRKLK